MISSRAGASASVPAGFEENWIAALSLTRRMPPRLLDRTLSGLVQLCPSLRVELLTRVDQKLKIRFDPVGKKYFIACIYNKHGDSYRSPWTNNYVPPARAAAAAGAPTGGGGGAAVAAGEKKPRPFKPSDHLRQLEVAYNELFDAYRNAYYDGGVSSVYLWSLQSEDGFAGAFLIHNSVDANSCSSAVPQLGRGTGKGCWDSIHVVEVTQTTSNVYYRLTSTVIIDMQQQQGQSRGSSSTSNGSSRNGSNDVNSTVQSEESRSRKSKFYAGVMITRSTEQSHKVGAAESRGGSGVYPHIGVIGAMIETMETNLRSTVERICLATAYSVIDCAFGAEVHAISAAPPAAAQRNRAPSPPGKEKRGGRGEMRVSALLPAENAPANNSGGVGADSASSSSSLQARAARIAAADAELFRPPPSLLCWDRPPAAAADARAAAAACAAAAAQRSKERSTEGGTSSQAAADIVFEAE